MEKSGNSFSYSFLSRQICQNIAQTFILSWDNRINHINYFTISCNIKLKIGFAYKHKKWENLNLEESLINLNREKLLHVCKTVKEAISLEISFTMLAVKDYFAKWNR